FFASSTTRITSLTTFEELMNWAFFCEERDKSRPYESTFSPQYPFYDSK
ncbi:hypothetical protein HMPREF0653_01196, partial [Prevotella disiens JCM 6334 = ATCC 29426]